jgi:teichuronic acid biosynthesis glycosyltransferase TuaC
MKVLIVCSGNAVHFSLEKDQAFIFDQIKSVEKINRNIQFNIYALKGKGVKGYLNQRRQIQKEILAFSPDLIHAHGGHVGLVCICQRKIPVVVTFHGSDVNNKKTRWISEIVSLLSSFSIFVSGILKNKLMFRKKNSCVLPCGVDFSLFYPINKTEAKKELGINIDEKYILFPSSFDNRVKNFTLAEKVLTHFPEYTIREIKNRTRKEVNLLMNGAELLLMTSFTEGSPQVIKEAMACNKKIVSVNVGDVSEQLHNTNSCLICSAEEIALTEALTNVLLLDEPMNNRLNAEKYSSATIANQLIGIYNNVAKQ